MQAKLTDFQPSPQPVAVSAPAVVKQSLKSLGPTERGCGPWKRKFYWFECSRCPYQANRLKCSQRRESLGYIIWSSNRARAQRDPKGPYLFASVVNTKLGYIKERGLEHRPKPWMPKTLAFASECPQKPESLKGPLDTAFGLSGLNRGRNR